MGFLKYPDWPGLRPWIPILGPASAMRSRRSSIFCWSETHAIAAHAKTGAPSFGGPVYTRSPVAGSTSMSLS